MSFDVCEGGLGTQRRNTGLVVLLIAVAMIYPVIIGATSVNDRAMGRQLIEAGYSAADLSNPGCYEESDDCAEHLVPFDSKDLVSVMYTPKGAPAYCQFWLFKEGPGILWVSRWYFRLDRNFGRVGPNDFGPAAKFKAGPDWSDSGVAVIRRPTPSELWRFLNRVVDGVDPACRPEVV